ncbi:MAG: type II toxin-antitoxin system Phd/YefM family antitoxin [Nitrospirae bacterium]|nr:type II toxin-antitoxin system Phd/YefM family antitoxin [Nitrospirota bacterium]
MDDKNKKQSRIAIEDLHVISATEAKNKFGDLLHRVCYEKTPVLIEKGGRPMAVVVDYTEYLKLKKLD